MLREWIKKRHSDLVMKQDWKRKIYIIGQCNWNETTGLAGFRLEVWKPGCERRGAEEIILLLCAKKKRRVWFKNNRNYSYFFKIVYWVLYYYNSSLLLPQYSCTNVFPTAENISGTLQCCCISRPPAFSFSLH